MTGLVNNSLVAIAVADGRIQQFFGLLCKYRIKCMLKTREDAEDYQNHWINVDYEILTWWTDAVELNNSCVD